MTTRTTLSAACPPWRATQAEPGKVFPAPWSSLASLVDASFSRDTGRWSRAAAFPWPPRPVRRGGRLIANLELESRLTCRKLSPLRISNRKFFAIFYLVSHLPLVCPDENHRRRRVAQFLIANARLEFPANHTKQSTATKSNRERIAISHLAPQSTIRLRIVALSEPSESKGFSSSEPSLVTRHSSLADMNHSFAVHESQVTSHESQPLLPAAHDANPLFSYSAVALCCSHGATQRRAEKKALRKNESRRNHILVRLAHRGRSRPWLVAWRSRQG